MGDEADYYVEIRFERRGLKRVPVLGTISYMDSEEAGKGGRKVAGTANATDVGACIFTDHELRAGDKIRVYSRMFATQPVEATVRWCSRISKEMYKTGLSIP